MSNTRTTQRRGFTLVELIIATAITTIILASIVALFVFALRAVKSGNAAMDANELTRAAFQVMERDLNSAFTSREHGELFHFHGNEVGMSFIGLARTYDASANQDVVQLGRVTYVINPIHESMQNGLDDDGNGIVDDDCDRYVDTIFMERLDAQDGSANGLDDDNDGLVDEPGELIKEMVEAQLVDPNCASTAIPPGVLTVSLLRYFEPGVESLDEYDPDILQRLDNAFTEGYPGIGIIEQQTLNVLDSADIRDAQILEEARRLYRRDGYIRMLANARLIDTYRNSAFAGSDGWELLKLTPAGDPRNQFDYVIAENILDIQSQKLLADGVTPPFHSDDLVRFPYFLYGRTITEIVGTELRTTVDYSTTWNSFGNMYEEIEDAAGNKVGIPAALKPFREPSGPQPGAPLVAQPGTPMEARLPEFVRVRLPFVFDSPYAGAPHLQRELQQDIRVPTAFTRRNPLAEL